MIKQLINADYISAWKGNGETSKKTKDALNNLKSKIIDAEKTKKVVDLSDEDVIKVISSAIKQRKDSVVQFTAGNRMDLVDKENFEISVFQKYLPTQLTDEEIIAGINDIATQFSSETNLMKKKGMITGTFNKKFNGMFDMDQFKSILDGTIKE